MTARDRKLCLNMIVKNEMANLPRCLGAVADHIGCWVIGDTGSSDGTQDFIRAFFAERGLPGELHSFPFVNFEQARNEALERAYASKLAYDYLLFDDADMELVVEDPDFRTRLETPGYQLVQRAASGLVYWNTRLARRDVRVRYHGVTHEYLDVPGGTQKLQGVWYKDHASGANRADKFERDARLLTEALQQEPENHRYWFYLAQSYRDAGRTKEAAEAYAKRAGMGGWDEEAWNARLQEARCLRTLGDEGGFLRAALAAFNQRPQRAEPLYDLARYYRERGMNDASMLFSKPGLALPRPEQDILFIEDFVYAAGLREEFSIAANYSRDPARKDRGHAAGDWLALGREVPQRSRDLARSNLFFYAEPVRALLPSFSTRPVGFAPQDGWKAINPSIARRGEQIVMVQRCVNFTLAEDGEYKTPDGSPITTRNFLLRLNADLGVESSTEILPPADLPAPAFDLVLGFEDARLFAWRGELWCISTVRQLTPEGWCEQVLARIDCPPTGPCRLVDWRVLRPEGPRLHEKNWMPLVVGDDLRFIYSCDPTRVVDEQARTVAEGVPSIAAEQFRGGSQAIEFDGGWLALIHEASERDRKRYYWHRFVWFDAEKVLRSVSRRFYFHKTGLEFAAGLAWHPDGRRLLISYGVDASEAWIATVEAGEVRAILTDAGALMPTGPSGSTTLRKGRQLLIIEDKLYSQNGEDGIIESIFKAIGQTNRFYVEVGCEDASECNTRKLSEVDGWSGIRIDNRHSDPTRGLYQHTVTPENVGGLLRQYAVPRVFDLFSIDIDFCDFHVLRAVLAEFSPRVVVSEYNASLGPDADCVVPCVRDQSWDNTDFFGASYAAFERLAEFFGYKVVHCDTQGVNIFLVRRDLLSDREVNSLESVFRPPGYRGGRGHPSDPQCRRYLKSEHYLLPGVATAQTPFGFISYFKNDIYIGAAFSQGHYWEINTVTEVAKRLKDCRGLVLDIGAHIGSHSIALAAMNPHLRFTCFEPQRSVFLLLERNIFENQLSDRFELLNVAVSNAAGSLTLAATVDVEEAPERRLVEYGGAQAINLGGVQLGVDGQPCQALCIDERVWPYVVYVKVDVEGAEPLVFYGMQKLLQRDLPHILFEDREDRRLDRATLDSIGVGEDVRNFSPRSYIESLGYQVERLGLDYIGRPPSHMPLSALQVVVDGPIPARIFQTWKSKHDFPGNYAVWSSTFSLYNPHFERILWDDGDNYSFISEKFPWFLQTYRDYPREIYRADAIRYFFLYALGGIYADMDVECLRPLDGLLGRGDVLLGRMGSNPGHPHSIPNAVMASKPRQEFWLLVIWLLMDAAKRGGPPEHVTGPVLIKSAVDLYLARDPQWVQSAIQAVAKCLPQELQPVPQTSNLTLLSSREWFAVDWTDPVHQILRREILHHGLLSETTKKELFPESWMVTYWTHNW